MTEAGLVVELLVGVVVLLVGLLRFSCDERLSASGYVQREVMWMIRRWLRVRWRERVEEGWSLPHPKGILNDL